MTGTFIRAAVIGHPVTHSKSPSIHGYWIAKYGLSGSYEAIDLSPQDLERGVRDLTARGYAGFNVTVPHKRAVMDLCAELDYTARRIGAVNTVIIGPDGALEGRNTDAFGFLENIRAAVPGFDFSAGPAVVLGAGGAARAVVDALVQAGAKKIVLANRTRDTAQELAQRCACPCDIVVADWEYRHDVLEGAALLVNTTSLGMKGQPPLTIDLGRLPPGAVVNDIVYAPLETDLLAAAKTRGNRTVTGIGMLLHQARPAFAAWFGVMPEVTDELTERVLSCHPRQGSASDR